MPAPATHRAAIAYRERFVQNTNAYRVIFSEADFLPGLIVDKYNDILSLQVLTPRQNAFAHDRAALDSTNVPRPRLSPRTL